MNNNEIKQTYFDSLISNRSMQLAKAVIPFMDKKTGAFFGIYIKILELKKTFEYANMPIIKYNSASSDSPSLMDELMNYVDSETRETLEMLLSVFSQFSDFSPDSENITDYMDILKNL